MISFLTASLRENFRSLLFVSEVPLVSEVSDVPLVSDVPQVSEVYLVSEVPLVSDVPQVSEAKFSEHVTTFSLYYIYHSGHNLMSLITIFSYIYRRQSHVFLGTSDTIRHHTIIGTAPQTPAHY